MTARLKDLEGAVAVSSDEIKNLLSHMTAEDFRLAYEEYKNETTPSVVRLSTFAAKYALSPSLMIEIIDTGRAIQAAYEAGMKRISER